MEKMNFSLAAIKSNFKALFADKKQFIFECVRAGLIFFYWIWLFLPYFTLREVGFGVIAHFNVTGHTGFLAFIVTMMGLAWAVGWILHVLSLVTPYKKFDIYILLGLGAIELLYWFITLIVYWVNLSDLNDLNIPTMSMPLNIGFWFITLHILMVVALALLPKPIKALTDKIYDLATKPKEVKPEPKVEPTPAPVEEPKTEPTPVQKPKPEPVAEPKPEEKLAPEEPKPEPAAEPKPEEKPAPEEPKPE